MYFWENVTRKASREPNGSYLGTESLLSQSSESLNSRHRKIKYYVFIDDSNDSAGVYGTILFDGKVIGNADTSGWLQGKEPDQYDPPVSSHC